MKVCSSYEQIFNQNEGLHDIRSNGKVIGHKITTFEVIGYKITTFEVIGYKITTFEGEII